VLRQLDKVGYSRFSLILASAVVKRQSTLDRVALRRFSQAATFALSVALSRADPSIEALASGEDPQLNLGHVEPAAMLGRVVNIEPVQQAANFLRLE